VNVAPHSRIAQEGDLALVRCRVSTDRILGDRVVGLASRQFVPEGAKHQRVSRIPNLCDRCGDYPTLTGLKYLHGGRLRGGIGRSLIEQLALSVIDIGSSWV
jgi:hypothetical protein